MRLAPAGCLRFPFVCAVALLGCHSKPLPRVARGDAAPPAVTQEATAATEVTAPALSWPTCQAARLQGFQVMLPFVAEQDGQKVRALFAGTEYVGETTGETTLSLRPLASQNGPLEVVVQAEGGLQVKKESSEDPYDEESAEGLEEGKEVRLEGTIGGKPVRMKLVAHNGVLTGRYRYPDTTSDLLLQGTLDGGSGFDLVERTGQNVTGRMQGCFASPDAWLGRWQPVDGSRSEPVTLGLARTGSRYPESGTFAYGVDLYAQETSLRGEGCTLDAAYPQLGGRRSSAALNALNDALRGPRASARTCADLKALEHTDATAERRPVTGTETYELGTTSGRFIGLRKEAAMRDMWATVRTATCWVIDTETLARVDLRSRLTPAGRSALEVLAGQRLAAQPTASYLPKSSAPGKPMTLTPDTELCLRDTGLEVGTPYVRVELRTSEVKDFFVDDAITRAMFGR